MKAPALTRALLALTLAFAPALAVVATAAPVGAEPPVGDPVLVDLGWPDLGLIPDLQLTTSTAAAFNVPVPTGLNPVRLRGLIQAPINIGSGYLAISDGDGKFLAAVDLPAMTSAQAVVPLDVDISAASIRDSSIDLSLTVRPTDRSDQACGPVQQLAVTDLSTVFAGNEPPPSTVADFFPRFLEQVTIYAPNDADASEQQAVLTLVSTLTWLYQPIPLEVRVVNLPRGAVPPPAGQLTRAVLVERGSAGLTVETPGGPNTFLRISGQGDELTSQTSLLGNDLQTLAQVDAARVDQPGSTAIPTGDTVTFAQLGVTGRVEVLRSTNFTVGIDRAALGAGRVESAQVHLLADYTPVTSDDSATVTVRSNDAVVYTAPLDTSGRLDTTFDLPSQTLAQRIALDFTVTYTPHHECGPFVAPLSFQIDSQSSLTVQRGGPPAGGFGAVPSEFSPDFYVALDGTGQNQLSHAARVVADIGRLTLTKLTPKVVDLQSAADSESGALIVANSASIEQTSLNPPLSGDGSSINAGLETVLRADIQNGLGSIQAFADPARNRTVVLVTTTGAWTLVDPLFGYIDGLDNGWAELTGDVLAAGAAGSPTNVDIIAGDDILDPPQAETSSTPWVAIGTVIAALALAAAIAGAWIRRRGQRA
ncbi:MAG: cellulose biosynthesis cyclic di-GMP-binding regulatory protein BcsB [Mycobacterium sp.]